MKFESYTLNEVAEIIDSLHQTPSYSETGFPMVRVTDIKERSIDFCNTLKVSKEVFEEFTKKYKPKKGDSLMTRVGSYGTCSYINDDTEFCLGQNTVVISPKVNSNYLFYWLKSGYVKRQIEGFVTGSTQKTISLRDIKSIIINIPSNRVYANHLAKVLSELDTKIELNNKINTELEAMAKLIYDYWFVQFDFPNEQGKPYKSSGGKMVFNEELKREIPEGWDSGVLGEIGKVSMCKRVMKHQTSTEEEIPFYKISTFGSKPNTFISKDLFELYRQKYSYPILGDILISAAGTIGKTVIFDGELSYFQDSNIVWIANDELKVPNSFLYYYYQKKPWIATNGSTIKRLYNDNIRNLKICYPTIDILDKYNEIVSPQLQKQQLIYKQNQKLSELRDWLLPMLMNGQVTVGEVEEKEQMNMAAEARGEYGK